GLLRVHRRHRPAATQPRRGGRRMISASQSRKVRGTNPPSVGRRGVSRAGSYIALTALALLFLFPFYWLLISAFKPQAQIFALPPQLIPTPPRVQNFVDLVRETTV